MHTNPLRWLTATLALLMGCAGVQRLSRSDADIAAIHELYREWPRSIDAADPAQYVSFLDDSITLLMPGMAPIHGIAAYRAVLVPLFQSATYHVSLNTPSLLEIAGPWAFAQYQGYFATLPKGGGDSSVTRNRYVDILRRQPDGTWRVFLHSWHTDAPLNR